MIVDPVRRIALAALMLAGASGVHAAACAGFADVEDTSPFCPNVEWVRNRSITLGCGPAAYCPNEPVTRLAMAAFMNRLGAALTPRQLRVEEAASDLDLDASPVMCQTATYAAEGYARRAVFDGMVNATAVADVQFAADPVYSLDAGKTWIALVGAASRGFVPASRWGVIPQVAHAEVAAGSATRFGIRLSRNIFGGTTDLFYATCQLRVMIYGM